ncbi:hypothetical protein D9M72_573730 [compost metagenome]
MVGVGGVPGQVQPGRPLLHRPHAVLPAVAGDEVPARIAHRGHAQLAGEFQDVGPEAVPVSLGVARFEDAGVDAAAQVLHKRAEGAAPDRPHGEGRVQGDLGSCLACGRFASAHVKILVFSFSTTL